jgi:hypothetical protein
MEDMARLFINSSEATVTYDLEESVYQDLESNIVNGELVLLPKTSRILLLTAQGGEGEGEGPPPICGALWIDGAPISSGVGDLALLTLVAGAMLLHRRTRTPGQSN